MDQLSYYLSNTYDSYITGFQDCNILIWGKPQQSITVPRFLSVTLGCEYNPMYLDQNTGKNYFMYAYNRNKGFHKMYSYGYHMAKNSNLPFIVILYPSLSAMRDCQWTNTESQYPFDKIRFLLVVIKKEENPIVEALDGKMLKERLCSLIGTENIEICGTSKEKNKTIADFFHYWSRQYLPSALTKLDIDGGFFNNGTDQIFVEIKRSNKPPIPKWRPYFKDKPNYRLQYSFCAETGIECWILHHDGLSKVCTEDTVISYFNVGGWEENPKRAREFLLYRDMILQLRLKGEYSLDSILRKTYRMQ